MNYLNNLLVKTKIRPWAGTGLFRAEVSKSFISLSIRISSSKLVGYSDLLGLARIFLEKCKHYSIFAEWSLILSNWAFPNKLVDLLDLKLLEL